MGAYAVYKGQQFTLRRASEYDPLEPVDCVKCGRLIEPDEPRFVNWDRHLHVGCARTVVGEV